MGDGIPSKTNNEPDKNWSDIPPDTVAEFLLKNVCSRRSELPFPHHPVIKHRR